MCAAGVGLGVVGPGWSAPQPFSRAQGVHSHATLPHAHTIQPHDRRRLSLSSCCAHAAFTTPTTGKQTIQSADLDHTHPRHEARMGARHGAERGCASTLAPKPALKPGCRGECAALAVAPTVVLRPFSMSCVCWPCPHRVPVSLLFTCTLLHFIWCRRRHTKTAVSCPNAALVVRGKPPTFNFFF